MSFGNVLVLQVKTASILPSTEDLAKSIYGLTCTYFLVFGSVSK
nr:MAG TPA: hypothetical protein [Caudoviricetes sp.]